MSFTDIFYNFIHCKVERISFLAATYCKCKISSFIIVFSKISELVYPHDGLRRLRQMEKSSGIWTQRMYLRLETSWLVIIDYENGVG